MLGSLTTKLYLKWIEAKGFRHGDHFHLGKGANIDAAFCKFISVGHHVTLTKDVYILAHDASMKCFLGVTKLGKVVIGNNVFIGTKSVVLCGTTIGDNCIIAANSTVTGDIPSGQVWGGSPAKYIMDTGDFLARHAVRKETLFMPLSEAAARLETEMSVYIL